MNAHERMAVAARQAGMPADQLRNFLRAGYVPQPKQMAFHAAARDCDAPDGPVYIGLGGGRAGAKSHAAMCQVAHDDCVRVPGSKWLYLRSVGASARESFTDMLNKALPTLLPYYVSNRSALELPNGSRIILGGFRNENDIDKYIGIEYDGILFDDAHLISKGKFDRVLGSMRTSKPNWRPRAYITFNPGGVGHAYLKAMFVEPWRKKQETESRFFFFLPEDNRFINPEYLKYLNNLSGWLYRAWRKGDFDIAAGQFFTNWSREHHVVAWFHIPGDWPAWLSMDYGFQHYCTIYLFAKSGDGDVHIMDEHAERKWLVPQHIQAVREMLSRNGVAPSRLEKFVSGGDVFAKRGGDDDSSIADKWKHWERDAPELTPANTSRIDGAAEFLSCLGNEKNRQTLYITDRCPRLIDCIPTLQHDPNRPEDVLKTDVDEEGLGGDDPYDGARYGLMEAARPPDKAFSARY